MRQLIELVEDNQGYPLYQAVAATKTQLSTVPAAELTFPPLGDGFSGAVGREDFERWIAPELERITGSLEDVLRSSQLDESRIDGVFLTGGSAFVPAVRRIFAARFGAAKIHSGDELLSVANGLALIGARDDAAQWSVV